MQTWFREVNPKISTVEQSITNAQWVVRRSDHRGLTSACRAITTKIAAYEKAPKSPDKTTRTALGYEMSAFRTAANECVSGELDAAGRSVHRGHYWAEVAGRRVVHVLHQSV